MNDTTQAAASTDTNAAAQAAAATASGGQQTQQTTQQTNGGTNGANGTSAASQTLAANGHANAGKDQTQEPAPYWPTDFREKIAEHISAGDKKVYEKELRRLQNMDPASIYGSFRTLENTWATKNFVQLPPKEGATEDDVKKFHSALGVPETVDGYFKDLKLENGAVLGEADKPVAAAFATAMHKAGATPAVVHAAINEYYAGQQRAADALDEADDTFRTTSEKALKDEFGPAFKRRINSIGPLFASAPGGTDKTNPKSLMNRLLGGRTADGKIIGDDPDTLRLLSTLSLEINPAAAVVEDASQDGKSIDTELNEIRKVMRENRPAYNKDVRMQQRFTELLAAQDKIRARAR